MLETNDITTLLDKAKTVRKFSKVFASIKMDDITLVVVDRNIAIPEKDLYIVLGTHIALRTEDKLIDILKMDGSEGVLIESDEIKIIFLEEAGIWTLVKSSSEVTHGITK